MYACMEVFLYLLLNLAIHYLEIIHGYLHITYSLYTEDRTT